MKLSKSILCSMALALGLSGSAFAATTPVNTAGSNGEPTLLTIIKNIYNPGGSIAGSIDGTLTLGNGITLVRVQDSGLNAGGTTLGLGDGDITLNNDTVWHDGTVNFTAEAKYASYKQSFGFKTSGGTETTVFADNNGSGTSGPTLVGPGQFNWWRSGWNTNTLSDNKWFSNPALNQTEDHMVTFEVLQSAGGPALNGVRTWLLAWEDTKLMFSDKDYNDFVVEVVAVPLPTSVLAGLSTLGVMGLAALRRRRLA